MFVSEFERKYPLRKPKALMEDNTRMRKEPMSRALAQRRVEEPSWEEEFRNV